MNVIDFFPRPCTNVYSGDPPIASSLPTNPTITANQNMGLRKWLVRRVQCMRGVVDVDVEVTPAFSEFIRPSKLIIYSHDQTMHETSI